MRRSVCVLAVVIPDRCLGKRPRHCAISAAIIQAIYIIYITTRALHARYSCSPATHLAQLPHKRKPPVHLRCLWWTVLRCFHLDHHSFHLRGPPPPPHRSHHDRLAVSHKLCRWRWRFASSLLGYDPLNVCGQGYLDDVPCGEDGVEVMYCLPASSLYSH